MQSALRTSFAVLAVLTFAQPLAAACDLSIVSLPEHAKPLQDLEVRIAGSCSDNCIPGEPDVRIENNRIDIAFEVERLCALPVVTPWAERVRLGNLGAGSYEVRVVINGIEAASKPLVVRPGLVMPYSGTVGTTVRIFGVPRNCPVGAQCPPTVYFGDQVATILSNDGTQFTVTAPPHEPGTVTIRVVTNGGVYTIPDAFTYSEDPIADSERVLFPILLEAAGAHGSQWTSDVLVHNAGNTPVPYSDQRGIIDPPPPPYYHLAPGEEYRAWTMPRDGGVMFHVARGAEPSLRYASHFRDLSRGDTDLGTEVPVVRERETAPVVRIVGVPNAPRYRAMLRVYDIDRADALPVRVILSRGAAAKTLFVAPVSLDASYPAFASVDLTAEAEALGGSEYDVTVVAQLNDRRLWAFVSVTNNETQHVTTFTPQYAALEAAKNRPRLLPSTGMAGHGVIVRGAARELCGNPCVVAVKFGNVASSHVRVGSENSIVAEVPPGTGVVDVSLSAGDKLLVLEDAFEYVADLSGWTRVLVPLDYAGGGAHGSQWTTVTRIRNHSGIALPVPERVPASNKDGGVFVHLPPGLEHEFAFSSHAIDLSRGTSDLGTEVRIAAQQVRGDLTFLGVPFDARYRVRLRVYDFGEQFGVPLTVTVQPENGPERNVEIVLQEEPGRAPWFALDLESIGGRGNVIVRGGSILIAGFLTITNNETQHVTTWHPQ